MLLHFDLKQYIIMQFIFFPRNMVYLFSMKYVILCRYLLQTTTENMRLWYTTLPLIMKPLHPNITNDNKMFQSSADVAVEVTERR